MNNNRTISGRASLRWVRKRVGSFRGGLTMLVLLAFTAGCGVSPETAHPVVDTETEPRDGLRVVSWNIQWFPGRSPQATEADQWEHRELVQSFAPSLKPDILLLQEIRDEAAAEWVVEAIPGLTLHVTTTFTRPDSTFSQQLVIASRFPARAGFAEAFTGIYADPEVEPYRGFAFAALEHPDGGTLLVYSVHLKSNHGEADVNVPMREESARQILAHMEEMRVEFAEHGPVRVIVGGDFNVLLEQEAMAHEQTLALFKEAGFHWAWEGVPFENRVTWPARGRFGDASFDHILTHHLPEATAEVIALPTPRLSDHLPVVLDVP